MELQYYKDAKHNYLILEAEIDDENLFQYRMLENNNIGGLLPFSLRNIDGCHFLYYVIDSRQSIKNRYEKKKMSYDKLKSFLSDLVRTSKNLGDYLLDTGHLVLSPEVIYEEFSTGKFSFAYDPAHEEVLGQSFFEELLDYVDLEDTRATSLIYSLLDMVFDETGIDLCILEKAIADDAEEQSLADMGSFSNSSGSYTPSDDMDGNKDPYLDDTDDEYLDDEDAEAKRNRKKKEKSGNAMYPLGVNFLMAILFAIIAGALWYLRYAYILTYEENILDLAVFMISVMMSLTCFILQLRANDKNYAARKGRNKKDKKIADVDERSSEEGPAEDNLFEYSDTVTSSSTGLCNTIRTDSDNNQRNSSKLKNPDSIRTGLESDLHNDIRTVTGVETHYKKTGFRSNMHKNIRTAIVSNTNNNLRIDPSTGEILDDEENEETVLLNFNFCAAGRKLYAEEDSGLENISLGNLPVIIGKLSSCTDAVIKDKSVSRMHARIFKEEGQKDSLWIQDLNSTNGTYINGKRLLPNEKMELNVDDEVAFGKCVFAYR